VDQKLKKSYSNRITPSIYQELETQIAPVVRDTAFRWSRKGVPHLLVELSNKTIYSLCYFRAYHYWKAFYPYGDGQEQQVQVLNTEEEILVFLKQEARKETKSE